MTGSKYNTVHSNKQTIDLKGFRSKAARRGIRRPLSLICQRLHLTISLNGVQSVRAGFAPLFCVYETQEGTPT